MINLRKYAHFSPFFFSHLQKFHLRENKSYYNYYYLPNRPGGGAEIYSVA